MENEMIAFRSIDQDGDIWSETAIVFKCESDVEKAFYTDRAFLVALFTDPGDGDRTLQEFEVHEINGVINSVTFYTEYAHGVELVRMNNGHIYEPS